MQSIEAKIFLHIFMLSWLNRHIFWKCVEREEGFLESFIYLDHDRDIHGFNLSVSSTIVLSFGSFDYSSYVNLLEDPIAFE